MIGQLQRKLTELSRNASPAVGPAEPADDRKDGALDMEALRLGLAALEKSRSTGAARDGNEVAAEFVP